MYSKSKGLPTLKTVTTRQRRPLSESSNDSETGIKKKSLLKKPGTHTAGSQQNRQIGKIHPPESGGNTSIKTKALDGPQSKSTVPDQHARTIGNARPKFERKPDTTFSGRVPRTTKGAVQFKQKGGIAIGKSRLTPMEMKAEIELLTEKLTGKKEELAQIKLAQQKENEDSNNRITKLEKALDKLEEKVQYEESLKEKMDRKINVYQDKLRALHLDPDTFEEMYSNVEEEELEKEKIAAQERSKAEIEKIMQLQHDLEADEDDDTKILSWCANIQESDSQCNTVEPADEI